MNIQLTPQETETLERYQRNVCERTSYVKVTCILMLSKKYNPAEVSDILGIDISTVYRYANAYGKDGIDIYLQTNYRGYWGMLSSTQISELRSELKRTLYTDSKQVVQWIKNRFGIKYTPSGIVDLLNRIGFTYKKSKQVPCEANSQKQAEFLEKLSGLLEESKESETLIYYADGVHPTHNTRSTHAWIEKGTEYEQPTVSGRDRININGLLNANNVSDVIALECKSVNAQTTKELYQMALEQNPKAQTIYIISDNATYYKNKELNAWLASTRIKQVFLPPYSPNLNLIERLWKFLRKKVINTSFYRTKEEFRQAILNFFKNIKQHKSELESLLTLKFHLINSQSFLG